MSGAYERSWFDFDVNSIQDRIRQSVDEASKLVDINLDDFNLDKLQEEEGEEDDSKPINHTEVSHIAHENTVHTYTESHNNHIHESSYVSTLHDNESDGITKSLWSVGSIHSTPSKDDQRGEEKGTGTAPCASYSVDSSPTLQSDDAQHLHDASLETMLPPAAPPSSSATQQNNAMRMRPRPTAGEVVSNENTRARLPAHSARFHVDSTRGSSSFKPEPARSFFDEEVGVSSDPIYLRVEQNKVNPNRLEEGKNTYTGSSMSSQLSSMSGSWLSSVAGPALQALGHTNASHTSPIHSHPTMSISESHPQASPPARLHSTSVPRTAPHYSSLSIASMREYIVTYSPQVFNAVVSNNGIAALTILLLIYSYWKFRRFGTDSGD
mmetsp:Transcript_743/g.1231  ORF Transcript_743/g.1231 Transcript_743/m.1231 type:complete len:381 (-) Transcript_743:217-1359(-)